MKVAGADACRGGWVAAVFNGRRAEVHVFRDFDTLWEKLGSEVEVVLADVPIGLPEDGRQRRCDILARRMLGWPRGASVFPVPCRQAVYAGSYREASTINLRVTGRKLSLQSWNICGRIREVDTLLLGCREARERVRETHPEVCFAGLRGEPMRHSKRSRAGVEERRLLLERWSGCTLRGAMKHDVLDALAGAVTAWLGLAHGFSRLPPEPEYDPKGLRMEILYFSPG